MSIRKFDFVVGPETSTLPDVGTPTNDEDTINKGYADSTYALRASWYDHTASKAGVKAIAVADRANGQVVFASDLSVFYWFDSDGAQTVDDDTVLMPDAGSGRWLKLDVSGGGGAGGGGTISDIKLGEDINNAPVAAFLWQKPYLIVDATNKFIDINEGGGELNATLTEGNYLFDTSANQDEFTEMVRAALQAAGGGGITYSVSLTAASNKINISGTGAFSILWKTGTHGSDNTDDHAGTLLGYLDTSDDTSSASHDADNEIRESYTTGLFAFKTDGDYPSRSRGIIGIIDSTGSKYATKSILFDQNVSGFSGFTEGDELLTKPAHIGIETGVNDAIDFDEGGGELNATLTPGEYIHPYEGIASEIKAQMDSAGGDTYTVTWDNDSEKFTISSSGTFSLDFGTGTNNATSPALELGFTETDHATAASHESDSAIQTRGILVPLSSEDVGANSVIGGFAKTSTDVFMKRDNGTDYHNVLNQANEFLSDPLEFNAGEDLHIEAQHENSQGKGVRIYGETASPADFRFYYKDSPGSEWINSGFTVPAYNGSATGRSTFSACNPVELCMVHIDDQDRSVAALTRFNTGTGKLEVWVYHSTDGGASWTVASGQPSYSNGAVNYFPGSIHIREDKAVFAVASEPINNTFINISDDSGSGFVNWTSVAGSSGVATEIAGLQTFIQYFPAEAGINQHRICTFHQQGNGGFDGYVSYAKGDGTSNVNLVVDASLSFYSVNIDKTGNGNKIFGVYASGGATDEVVAFFTNDTYNSGTLTVDTDSGTNRNAGGGIVDENNGCDDSFHRHWKLGIERRCFVRGEKAFFIVCTQTNDANVKPAVQLWHTNSLSTHSWTGPIQLSQTVGVCTEGQMAFVPGSFELLVTWKYHTDTEANNPSNGQIFARRINVEGDSPILSDFEQIDGGESLAGYQGWSFLTSNNSTAQIGWVHDAGAQNNVRWNKYL